jgi:hypothetical protein
MNLHEKAVSALAISQSMKHLSFSLEFAQKFEKEKGAAERARCEQNALYHQLIANEWDEFADHVMGGEAYQMFEFVQTFFGEKP